MPKVRRQKLPEALLRHLLARVRQREIPDGQIILLSQWLDANPEVPDGKWFKKFPGLTVCGEGELIKTFLQPGQLPAGEEVKWNLECGGTTPLSPTRHVASNPSADLSAHAKMARVANRRREGEAFRPMRHTA